MGGGQGLSVRVSLGIRKKERRGAVMCFCNVRMGVFRVGCATSRKKLEFNKQTESKMTSSE